MTTNIALLTGESIVLGCDSLASNTRPLIDPFDVSPAIDAAGIKILDGDGNEVVAVSHANIAHVVSDVVAGVKKMFEIYHDGHTTVAAVTAGLGSLSGKPIAVVAEQFRTLHGSVKTSSSKKKRTPATVEDVA